MELNSYAKKMINQPDENGDSFAKKDELFTMDMVHNNPGLLPYESNYMDHKFLRARNIDGKVYCFSNAVQFALLWDKFDKEIFPEGSKEREEILENKKRIKALYADAKNNGVKAYFMMDLISLPVSLVKKYGDEILEGDKIDVLKPLTKILMDHIFDEMFDEFPELDGIYIRYGENYVGETYGMPLFRGNNPIIGDDITYHMFLIKYLREKVCVEKNKDIMYRTWGFGSFQSDPEQYVSISSQIEPHENLYFCIKHTVGDFHRNVGFNQQLNRGIHKQVIEVQCAREYEGKGAFPNYVGAGVINGFEELDNFMEEGLNRCLRDVINVPETMVKGIWIWSRGGGWNGPYINGVNGIPGEKYPENINGEVKIKNGSELWCDLNAYVVTSWAKDTSKTDKYYVKKYATEILGMGAADAEELYKLCILSSRGVLVGRSMDKGYYVNSWWFRDQNISYDNFIGCIKDIVEKNQEDALLKERAESVEIWKEIVSITENFSDDLECKNFMVTTAKYGFYLFAIIEKMYRMNVLRLKKDDSYKAVIDEYEELWKEWQSLYETEDCCPSLYIKEDKPMDLIGYGGNVGFDAALRDPFKA